MPQPRAQAISQKPHPHSSTIILFSFNLLDAQENIFVEMIADITADNPIESFCRFAFARAPRVKKWVADINTTSPLQSIPAI